MAWDETKGFVAGFLVGASAGWAARELLSVVSPIAKPLVKQGMKTAILGYERSREVMATCVETLSDVMAEVQHELKTERDSAAAPSEDTASGYAAQNTAAQTRSDSPEAV